MKRKLRKEERKKESTKGGKVTKNATVPKEKEKAKEYIKSKKNEGNINRVDSKVYPLPLLSLISDEGV